MRFKCKKEYSDDFEINKSYDVDEELSVDGFYLINRHWFYDIPQLHSSNLSTYFYSECELRKEKLKKLQNIQ